MLNLISNLKPIGSIYSIAVLFFLLLHFNLTAQIGSIGGFNNIGLSYQNDLVLSAGTNFNQSLNYEDRNLYHHFKTYDAQAAYAFYKYIGVQAGYQRFLLFNDEELNLCASKSCKQSNSDHYFNVAIGAFYTFDLKKTLLKNNDKDYKLANKAHIIFDVYLGYGKGFNTTNILNRNGYTREMEWNSSYTLKFDNYYIQPDFMFNGHFIGGGFSAFYSFIKFNKINLLSEPTNSTNDLISMIEENPVNRVYGLNFKLWVGIKPIKIVYNINRKYIVNNDYIQAEYISIFNNYSHLVSLQFNLGEFFK